MKCSIRLNDFQGFLHIILSSIPLKHLKGDLQAVMIHSESSATRLYLTFSRTMRPWFPESGSYRAFRHGTVLSFQVSKQLVAGNWGKWTDCLCIIIPRRNAEYSCLKPILKNLLANQFFQTCSQKFVGEMFKCICFSALLELYANFTSWCIQSIYFTLWNLF